MQYYKNSKPTPIPNPRASLSPFLAMTGMVKLTSIRIGSSLGSACSKQEPIAYRYMIPNPTLTEGLRTSLSTFSTTLRSAPSAATQRFTDHSLFSYPTTLPRLTKECNLTGQCGLFQNGASTLKPNPQPISPPSESAPSRRPRPPTLNPRNEFGPPT
jgi:hypothetical protein